MAYQEFQQTPKLALRRCGRVFQILVDDSTAIKDLTMRSIPISQMELLFQWVLHGTKSDIPKTFAETLQEAMKAAGGYGEGKRLAKWN